MPELPDVEVYRRYIDATSLHKPLDGIEVPSPEVLTGTTPQGLGRAVKDHEIGETRRHGKYLFAMLDDGSSLVLHFGMTGDLAYAEEPDGAPPYAACLFRFADGARLAYVAPRKLGMVSLTDSVERFVAEHELGQDALALTQEEFRRLASGRRGSVKSWLMNQSIIAGIGNVYSDEILFQAGIHPRRSVSELDADEMAALWEGLQMVMEDSIAAGAEPTEMPSSFLLPHRNGDGHCPRCGAEVRKIKVSGRSAWYCPRCQPLS